MKIKLLCLCFTALLLSTSMAKEKNTMAPAFTGKTLKGEALTLADYKGKVVVLDFWASWCGPCKEEFPFLVALHEKLRKNNFSVISVNVDTEVESAREFLRQFRAQPTFPIVVDTDGKVPRAYNVEGMPTTLLIDKNGMIRYRHVGFNKAEMEKIIDETATLLKE